MPMSRTVLAVLIALPVLTSPAWADEPAPPRPKPSSAAGPQLVPVHDPRCTIAMPTFQTYVPAGDPRARCRPERDAPKPKAPR